MNIQPQKQTIMPFFKVEKKAVNDLWYPRTVTVGRTVEMEDVCKRIAEMSTASEPDTKAVLSALGKVLGDLMNTGRTVHLEGLGYFYYSCLSTGQGKEAKEDVDETCIVGTRVQFLPERRVRKDGTVTRNLVDDNVFWVNVETMGANPDKVSSPDDEQEEEETPGGGEGTLG